MYFLLAVGSDRFMKPLKWQPLKVLYVLLQSDEYTHLTLVFMPFINRFVSLVSKPKVFFSQEQESAAEEARRAEEDL